MISIHALLAESDYPRTVNLYNDSNFYPRSPCGERLSAHRKLVQRFEFLSTLSLRRATRNKVRIRAMKRNFYPRSPCGERPSRQRRPSDYDDISIHALLAESDDSFSVRSQRYCDISIHALLAESDIAISFVRWMAMIFLSTLSLRRATQCRRAGC